MAAETQKPSDDLTKPIRDALASGAGWRNGEQPQSPPAGLIGQIEAALGSPLSPAMKEYITGTFTDAVARTAVAATAFAQETFRQVLEFRGQVMDEIERQRASSPQSNAERKPSAFQ